MVNAYFAILRGSFSKFGLIKVVRFANRPQSTRFYETFHESPQLIFRFIFHGVQKSGAKMNRNSY